MFWDRERERERAKNKHDSNNKLWVKKENPLINDRQKGRKILYIKGERGSETHIREK